MLTPPIASSLSVLHVLVSQGSSSARGTQTFQSSKGSAKGKRNHSRSLTGQVAIRDYSHSISTSLMTNDTLPPCFVYMAERFNLKTIAVDVDARGLFACLGSDARAFGDPVMLSRRCPKLMIATAETPFDRPNKPGIWQQSRCPSYSSFPSFLPVLLFPSVVVKSPLLTLFVRSCQSTRAPLLEFDLRSAQPSTQQSRDIDLQPSLLYVSRFFRAPIHPDETVLDRDN